MKIIFLFLIGILIIVALQFRKFVPQIITGSVSRGRAAGSVNMNTTVVERKSTDTINDFDFSTLGGAVQPQVLGASTDKNANYCSKEDLSVKNAKNTNAKNANFWQKIINLFQS